MGATLGTPTRCRLCDEPTQDPVTLKCDHRFCSRCIGDLWSVTPNGPYHCPESRCKTVYRTLPRRFDRGFMRHRSGPSPWSEPSNSTAMSRSAKSESFSAWPRPSFTSQLLGKRKASVPLTDQRDAKRSSECSPSEYSNSNESPSTSNSCESTTTVNTPMPDVHPESTLPGPGDSLSSCNTSSSEMLAECNVPENLSVQQSQREPEVITLDDCDSASEVDMCVAALFVTAANEAGDAEFHASPEQAASPPKSGSSPRVSPSKEDGAPVQHTSSSVPFAKRPATSSNSSGYFSMQERKNAGSVHCHYCPKSVYVSAVKTCLVCGASMCTEHLRPHLESPVFQNHPLISPMEDVSAWRCQEHQETNRIYCRQCEVCVCTVCTVIGSHRDHVCISIKEAERELRANLKDEIKKLQQSENQVKNRVTDLTQKRETFKEILSEAGEGVKQQYGAIREVLEQEEQSALACVLKEESRVMDGLEEKLAQLQRSLLSVQKGLHTLEGLADTRTDMHSHNPSFIMEYNRVTQLASSMTGCEEQFKAPEEVDRVRLKCLQRWTEKRLDTIASSEPDKDRDLCRLLYGITPVLDPDTAHLKLHLSENNRMVTYSDAQQSYAENKARFCCFPQVLASCALEGGCWYWEVDVPVDNGRWKVGLCEGQMERSGQKDNARLGFNPHSWCLAFDGKKLEAQHNKVCVPVAVERLRRVGVFLNLEEGSLSFFNVTPGGTLAPLHSYKHRFSAPLHPAFSVSKTHLAICDLFQI